MYLLSSRGKQDGWAVKPTGMLAPHPVSVDEDRYRNSQFCGRCHEGTFKEWSDVRAENKHNCQECHMPPVKRRITQSKKFISKMIVATEDESLQKNIPLVFTWNCRTLTPFISP